MKERVLHALDLGMLGDWDGAKRSLEDLDDPIVARLIALLTEQQRGERERAEMQAAARHELGNAISIAQANVEALVDGVLEPTPERLTCIRDAMIACGALLDDLKNHYRVLSSDTADVVVFDLCELIASQISLVSPIAESKNVKVRYKPREAETQSCANYRGNPERVALVVRDTLLAAVRYTPPGGVINFTYVPPECEVEVSVSAGADRTGEALGFSVLSKLLDAIGGRARILSEQPRRARFALHLAGK